MPLKYDPNTSEIRYEEKVVGRHIVENGAVRVNLNITYECDQGKWAVPVAWFAYGLSLLAKHRP